MLNQKDYDKWTSNSVTQWWMRPKVFEVQSELACTLFGDIHKPSKNVTSWSKTVKYLWPLHLQRLFQMWRSNTFPRTPQNRLWHWAPRIPGEVQYAPTSHMIQAMSYISSSLNRDIFLKPNLIISQNPKCKKSVFNQHAVIYFIYLLAHNEKQIFGVVLLMFYLRTLY